MTAPGHPASKSRAWALAAAAGVAAAESTILIAVIAFGSVRSGPVLVAALALKYPFCYALTRRRPGAWMALLLWEVTGIVAALAKPGIPLYQRVTELGLAGGCLVLLVLAASTFPAPTFGGVRPGDTWDGPHGGAR
jgi:hypothetical protein